MRHLFHTNFQYKIRVAQPGKIQTIHEGGDKTKG